MSGEDPRTSLQQHASPVPSVAAFEADLLCLLYMASVRCDGHRLNRIYKLLHNHLYQRLLAYALRLREPLRTASVSEVAFGGSTGVFRRPFWRHFGDFGCHLGTSWAPKGAAGSLKSRKSDTFMFLFLVSNLGNVVDHICLKVWILLIAQFGRSLTSQSWSR